MAWFLFSFPYSFLDPNLFRYLDPELDLKPGLKMYLHLDLDQDLNLHLHHLDLVDLHVDLVNLEDLGFVRKE